MQLYDWQSETTLNLHKKNIKTILNKRMEGIQTFSKKEETLKHEKKDFKEENFDYKNINQK